MAERNSFLDRLLKRFSKMFDDLVKESMTSTSKEEVKESKTETNQEEAKALKDETVVVKNGESEKDSKNTVKDAEKIDAKKEKINNK